MSYITAPSLYPSPSEAALKLNFVGKHVKDVPAPAVIMDVAPVRRNCKAMLDTAKALGVHFRAHVKTHKTTELTRLQMGECSQDIRLVASTIAEVEQLTPYLLECKARGSTVNVLYGLPVALSLIPRLAAVTRIVGEGSVGLFIDHPAQVKHLSQLDDKVWPGVIPVFVKIDAGHHRAGLTPASGTLDTLVGMVTGQSKVRIVGAYAHMGNSYASSSPAEALAFLIEEIKEVQAGADRLTQALPKGSEKLTLSVGATPTATAAQNILDQTDSSRKCRAYLEQVKQSYHLELHAGVYPVLDMQQLAARARPEMADGKPLLSSDNLALRILVEVASVYEEREKPEALVGAGAIVLGREPCKSYPGWGVVTPWQESGGLSSAPIYDPGNSPIGWIMGRISQEHGSLTWEGPQDGMRKLEVGEKVMLWPNHACMSGPSFGWYLVVDSDSPEPDVVKDVWVRWRGW